MFKVIFRDVHSFHTCSELGPLDVFNPATAVIDFCHYMGWAWDLKKPSRAMIEKKMQTYGDPTFSYKQTTNSVCEWVGGVLVVFAPWLAIRWILMAINS